MGRHRKEIGVCFVLLAVTVAVFCRLSTNGFINFDTREFILENQTLRQGLTWEGIRWAFTTSFSKNWLPLSWLSHMLDFQLYGMNPGGHHLTSLAIHTLNAILLFLTLRWATGRFWASALAAALFAIHPLQVESVAWTFQRKTVLNGFFWMLTLLAYVGYAARPGAARYLLVLLMYALSLLAKSMSVTLPFLLLLLDYWPLKRITLNDTDDRKGAAAHFIRSGARLTWEKLPLFVMAFVLSVVTYMVQSYAMRAMAFLSLKARIENALISYASYICNFVWPRHLAVFYPHRGEVLPAGKLAASVLVLGLLSVLAVKSLRRRPYLAVGWFWFLGTLVPVIGLVQVGLQAMADRYMYVPLIGLAVMVAWGARDLSHKWRDRRVGIWAGALVLVFMGCTWSQVRLWHSGRTLYMAQYAHEMRVKGNDDREQVTYGKELARDGKLDEAAAHFRTALSINPRNEAAHKYLGDLLIRQGRLAEAVEHYRKAVQIHPDYVKARMALGTIFMEQGKVEEAIGHFRNILQIKPDDADAHTFLGLALARKHEFEEAARHYHEALRLDPDNVSAHYNLASILVREGDLDGAMEHYRAALKADPKLAPAYFNLGVLLREKGMNEAAMARFRKALELMPKLASAHNQLGELLAEQGRTDEALGHFREALRIKPDFSAARKNLEKLSGPQSSPDR